MTLLSRWEAVGRAGAGESRELPDEVLVFRLGLCDQLLLFLDRVLALFELGTKVAQPGFLLAELGLVTLKPVVEDAPLLARREGRRSRRSSKRLKLRLARCNTGAERLCGGGAVLAARKRFVKVPNKVLKLLLPNRLGGGACSHSQPPLPPELGSACCPPTFEGEAAATRPPLPPLPLPFPDMPCPLP